jgi:choline dehydrogenase-like flavoprotein
VIILEEGGHFTAKDFDGTEEKAYRNLYRRRAGQSTDDLSVTILQGRCVGGSSTVNWTTSLRTPEFVLATWVKQFGLSHRSPKEMEPYFDRVERYLHIHLEPDEHHSPNNRIILDGARALGYRAMATGRNTNDCIKAGACGLGCPFDAKMSVDRTYVPDAIRAGATLFPNFRAERIEVKGRMKRVHGDVLDRETNEPQRQFAVEAPVVIVSAGAIHSPLLLLNSKVANSSGEVGRNLTLHVTTAVLGIFDRVIYAAGGIPQSAMCNEFLNKNGDGGGYWIEAVPVYPALAGIAVPSFGKTHQGLMEQYPHIGASIVLVKEIDSNGRITANEYGRPSISYTLREKDLSYLKHSLEVTARIHFAGGAKTVMTLHTEPMEFHSVDEIGRKLERAPWGKNELALFSAHPLGTCRMGSNPRRSVVDAHCQSHDVKGLFVIDGSVTPTSLGVNPQMTILSLAEQSAEWVAENWTDVAHG